MSSAQSILDQYIEKYGYIPKQPRHLIAFAKTIGDKIKYTEAKSIIAANKLNKPRKTQSNSSYSTIQSINTTNTAPVKSPPNIQSNQKRTTITTPPKNTAAATNDDEKKLNPSIANPILCRVSFECSSETAKKEIFDALNLFVKLQLETPYPGTLMYHFSCPDAIHNPLRLDFIELYFNEIVYWMHASSRAFSKAFFKAFKEKNRKSRAFITVGDNLSEMVKRINGSLDSTFPASDSGYLLHDDYVKAFDSIDETKVLLKFNITSPQYYSGNKDNVQLILKIMNKLSVYAKESYAVMFHSHRLVPKTYPDRIELISIWPKEDCLKEFLYNEKVQGLITEFKNLMIEETSVSKRKSHFLCELYSAKLNEELYQRVETVFDDIGVIKKLNTDIGYILHPMANSENFK